MLFEGVYCTLLEKNFQKSVADENGTGDEEKTLTLRLNWKKSCYTFGGRTPNYDHLRKKSIATRK